jgi:hypothetical protein
MQGDLDLSSNPLPAKENIEVGLQKRRMAAVAAG